VEDHLSKLSKAYPKAMFVDETLKKLNTSNSNEEESK